MITNDPSPLPTQPVDQPDPDLTQNLNQLESRQTSAWGDVVAAFLVWIGSVALLLFVPLAAIIPYVVSLAMKGVSLDPVALGKDKTFLFLSIISVIPAHALTLLGIWIVVKKRWKGNFWDTLKCSWPPMWSSWRGLALCSTTAVLLLGVGWGVVKILGGDKTDLDFLIESSFAARIATAFLAVATAPLVEEIVYRGLLYPAIHRLLGMSWSVIVVTLMFALVHVPQYKNSIGVIAVITILSVVLTIVRAWTDRLLPSIVIHLIFNGVQSLLLVLEPFVSKPEKVETAPTLIMLSHLLRHFF